MLWDTVSKILTLLVWSASTGALCFAQGGPPMVTDDPGTPPDGHWKINIATLISASSSQDLFNFPYFDINYGWGPRLQLKVETGWAFDGTSSGGGPLLVGTKYRFLDEETAGIAVSTYPQFQFHSPISSSNSDLAAPGRLLILPLEFSKTFGLWEINPELGYIGASQGSDQVFLGAVLAYEGVKPFEPLFETHAACELDGSGTETLLNFGFRYTFDSNLNLLGALGKTVTRTAGSVPVWDGYLGLQIEY